MIARTEANFWKIFGILAVGLVSAVVLVGVILTGPPPKTRQVATLTCANGDQLGFELQSGDIVQLILGVHAKGQRPIYYKLAVRANPTFGHLELRAYPDARVGVWFEVKSDDGTEWAYLDLEKRRFYNSFGVATSGSDSPNIESTHYGQASFPRKPDGLAPSLDQRIVE
jgi:hypothetical protein